MSRQPLAWFPCSFHRVCQERKQCMQKRIRPRATTKCRKNTMCCIRDGHVVLSCRHSCKANTYSSHDKVLGVACRKKAMGLQVWGAVQAYTIGIEDRNFVLELENEWAS
ncbi:hypothetical protein NPIL_38961 [Nephila pilipes]|uniref:Uncharacterized protein n=1 Tax=Nephila pilipes TaxID=299642 RepID=A0A8X6NX00_NEPPI|nr:hypothetical protein NPIL_38961 [Nephila pilipes]